MQDGGPVIRRRIGSLEVSVVGLGCNNFGRVVDGRRVDAVVGAALDAGITFFDTADVYGDASSEVLLGRAVRGVRDDVVIATKFGLGDGERLPKGAGAAAVRAAAEGSLRRLGTDRIDLYQVHAPDDSTPVEETLAALDGLVQAGKVREVGCSQFDGPRLDHAAAVSSADGTVSFVSVQNELSLLARHGEREIVEACSRQGMALLPHFPLANGLLTGKYRRGEDPPPGSRVARCSDDDRLTLLADPTFDVLEALDEFARSRGHTLLELAIGWLAGFPCVASVFPGATIDAQVRANAAASVWTLSDDDRVEIDRLAPPRAEQRATA